MIETDTYNRDSVFTTGTACTRRALKRRKRPDPLQILAEASLAGHDTRWRVFAPNLSKFGKNFVILKYFGLKTGFSVKRVAHSYAHFFFGTLAEGNLCIFGFFMISYASSGISEAFHQILDGQKAQKHHENHLAATFCTSRKYFSENEVWRGK